METANLRVNKDNELIEARLADFKMSVTQNRIIAWMASLVHSQNDSDFKVIKTNTHQISEIARHKYTRFSLEKDLRDLRKATAVVRKGSKDYICGIIDTAVIDRETGEVQLRLNDIIKPYLLKLGENQRGFTSYLLEAFLEIKSANSQKLFEILSQWSRKGEVTFPIEKLKHMMSLCEEVKQGEFKYKYPQWRDFERDVLRQAEKDLCNAGMHVFYKGVKTGGKKITHVEFSFWSNKENIDDLKKQFSSLFMYPLSDWERMQIAYSNMPQRVAMAIIEYDKTNDIKVLKALMPKSKADFYKRYERVKKLKAQKEKESNNDLFS